MLADRAGGPHHRVTATVSNVRIAGTMPPRIKNSPAARGGNGAARVSPGQVKKILTVLNVAGCCDRDALRRLKSCAYFAPIAGDTFATGLRKLLKHACAITGRWEAMTDIEPSYNVPIQSSAGCNGGLR